MMEVREVLRRLSAGQALREIARGSGLERKTVRRYAEAALVRRFVQDELGWGKRVSSVRLDDSEPGQEAQIDFGCMGPIATAGSATRRSSFAFRSGSSMRLSGHTSSAQARSCDNIWMRSLRK
ncbi:MAG: hypothetical protein JWN04_905 [Myxococcaceae bacterium]|nr:hypothetical protein [Myxococcaceae bacterium]